MQNKLPLSLWLSPRLTTQSLSTTIGPSEPVSGMYRTSSLTSPNLKTSSFTGFTHSVRDLGWPWDYT